MEKIVINVPSMYADHHVLSVRNALDGLEGIEDLYASSAWKQLLITFDPKKIKQAKIEEAIIEAGYPVDGAEPAALVTANDIKRDPQWQKLGSRSTETNIADLKMSGEFRRY